MLALHGGASLRPWVLADAPAMLRLSGDALVRHYGVRAVDDLDAAKAWVLERTGWWSEGRGGAWALEHDGEVVGSALVRDLDEEPLVGSVGYALSAAARGRGWASAACRAVTAAAFERLGWHRVELYHAVENVASCAVARRCGFALEGTMRSAVRYADGRWSDEHLHARLADDPQPRGW